ncbi:MAG: hypothetical protein CMC63_07530 [Flavobacteriaceae bacterium]|nr:hypothetical protein [Flavobacteriaceae bacterium]
MKLLKHGFGYLVLFSNLLFPQKKISLQDSISDTLKTNTLDEVVVIDSRFPLNRSKSGKSIIYINSRTIQKFQGQNLSTLLKQYTGIEILGSQTYAGQNKTVSIRGGRNRQVLILIDGVRVSDPSRIDNDFDLNFLDLSQINSIEILKGASSSLYGSSASTGVINIITKKPELGYQLSLQSSTGSQNSQDTRRGINLFKNSLSIGKGWEDFSTKAYFAHHSATGMSAVVGDETDPFNHLNYGMSFEYKNKSKFNLSTGYDHSNIKSDYDNSFPLEDSDYKLLSEMDRIYFNSNYNYKNGGVSLLLGYQNIIRDFQSSFPFQTYSQNFQLELFNKYVIGDRFYTVFGTLIQKNIADYEGGQKIDQIDFFGNIITKITDQFRVNIGGRWNTHSSYGSNFTYSINPSLQLFEEKNNSIKLIASLSTAFIAPSLYQLFDPYSGNLDLKPEENISFETGFVLKLKDWELVSTYFNRLESPSLIYDLSTYRYENANDKARYYGVEASVSGSLALRWNFNHQMTFTQTQDGDLRYLPNFSSLTHLSYKISKNWNADLSGQLIGRRFGLDNQTILDEYQLINISLIYQFKSTPLKLFLHGTNLFNSKYVEIEGYATQGRNFVAGLNYQL